MMRAESSILGLVEIVGGVAISAGVREIADSSCRSHLRSVMAPSGRDLRYDDLKMEPIIRT